MTDMEKQSFGYWLGCQIGLVINWWRWRLWLWRMNPQDVVRLVAKVTTLRGERDEIQRRLDAVVAMLAPGERIGCLCGTCADWFMPECLGIEAETMNEHNDFKRPLHARAVAIAEGRES